MHLWVCSFYITLSNVLGFDCLNSLPSSEFPSACTLLGKAKWCKFCEWRWKETWGRVV